ncbi:flagellar hook-basal body complex protein FliE [Granulicella sibirica]|uniref:Flagellar hook-basal body complex protein FliE n=1 Tax=Granulicella sibirica TaxID=2479048 RepID=A0A4Q0T0Z0_9BACT|nr:flagellar hook-basal body complex protein FliE [Granulicella sibirica]RXH57275.1 flagellar hook-basal body complex subunit FliE [Granulicella sibirica]
MSMSISGLGISSPITTGAGPLSFTEPDSSGSNGGFGDVLKNAISQVSNLQGGAEQQVNTLLQGGSNDMSKVMISVEKADVAFQLMMQVRNKIVSAYQDIEKMQF